MTETSTPPRAVDVLLDSFGRIPGLLHDVADDIDREALLRRPEVDGRAGNSIGWLLWHIARMQDVQIAHVAGTAQVQDDGWTERLAVPYPPQAMGYGMSDADVAAFTVSGADALTAYYDAVHARTVELLDTLSDTDLARVVDAAWDPPVTLLVRLVSIVDDAAQHTGQAAYLKGLFAN